jgi:hypothetical protein
LVAAKLLELLEDGKGRFELHVCLLSRLARFRGKAD